MRFLGCTLNNQYQHNKYTAMKTIAILGLGAEGNFWRSFIESHDLGLVVTSDCAGDNQLAIDQADIVIISVPMSAMRELISSCRFSADQLVISVVGEWTQSSKALKNIPAEWILLHRMCGPVTSMKGQNLIINRENASGHNSFKWYLSLLMALDANNISSDKYEHDLAISITQTLLRLIAVCFFAVLLQSKVNLQRIGLFSSPPYRILKRVMIRILGQGPGLCFDMLSSHVHARDTIVAMSSALEIIRDHLDRRDRDGFEKLFRSFEPLVSGEDRRETQEWFTDAIKRGD